MATVQIKMISSGEDSFAIGYSGETYKAQRRGAFQLLLNDPAMRGSDLPLTETCTEALFQAMFVCRLLGIDLADVDGVSAERRKVIEDGTRNHLKARGLIS